MINNADVPVLRLACRSTKTVWFSNRNQPGLVITSLDIRLLRLLAARDITIILAGPGKKTYTASIKELLRNVHPIPNQGAWYVTTGLSGPLRELAPRLPVPNS